MIAITGATGQLGGLVLRSLQKRSPVTKVVATARDSGRLEKWTESGIVVREADYEKPETLKSAFEGVQKLLLISSSDVGKRFIQHKAVIDAAKTAGVELLVYTSILRADRSTLWLAEEHKQTENYLSESGIPHTILRNGWYTENYTMSIPAVMENGVMVGCAGTGKFSTATREDFAEAAAAVLTSNEHLAGKRFELAGDHAFSLSEYADEISRQTGKSISYKNLSEEEYAGMLINVVGLPEPFAKMLANSEICAASGELFDGSKTLSSLIGRPTTPLSQSISSALEKMP